MFARQYGAGETLVSLSDLERGQDESFIADLTVDQNTVTATDSRGREVTLPPGMTLDQIGEAVRAVIPQLRPPVVSETYPSCDLSPHMQWIELIRDCGVVINVLYPQLLLLRIRREASRAVIVVTDGAEEKSFALSLSAESYPSAVLDDIKFVFFGGVLDWEGPVLLGD